MTPETRARRSVELYRADHFPTAWSFDRTIMKDVNAIDPTIVVWNDVLYLFVGMSDGTYSPNDELFLFYASDLEGPWLPDPLNTIVMDVRRARPAGVVFEY